jgi:hypothetical protein
MSTTSRVYLVVAVAGVIGVVTGKTLCVPAYHIAFDKYCDAVLATNYYKQDDKIYHFEAYDANHPIQPVVDIGAANRAMAEWDKFVPGLTGILFGITTAIGMQLHKRRKDEIR